MNISVPLFLEIKTEYTEFLTDTLTPYIYEGLTSIYKESVKTAMDCKHEDKIMVIFQKILQSIEKWSQDKINKETLRIKQLSGTIEYLDNLVKAVIKSYLNLLTYSNKISNIIGQSFYDSFKTSTFIHQCYIECGKYSHNHPYLFYHGVDAIDYKRNQLMISSNIKEGIIRAIRKVLPISLILKEYLINTMNIIAEPDVELLNYAHDNNSYHNNRCDNIMHNATNNRQLNVPIPINDFIPLRNTMQEKNINEQNSMLKSSDAKVESIDFQNVDIQNMNNQNINPELDIEIQKMISTENKRTETQKIQDLIKLDQLITNMEPNRSRDINYKTSGNIGMQSSSLKSKHSDCLIHPNFLEDDNSDSIVNDRIDSKDKNILNINIDNENTKSFTNKKSVTPTTMTNNVQPRMMKVSKLLIETSERVDPSKVAVIENYGYQNNGSKSRNSRKHML